MQKLSETSDEEIMYLKGKLNENHRWMRTVMTMCDMLLAVNLFMTVLLALIYLGWI